MLYLASKRHRFSYRPSFRFDTPEIRRMVLVVVPIFLGKAITELNTMIDRTIASLLPEGSVSALSYGNRVVGFVTAVFVISVTTAVFPQMSRLSAMKSTRKLKRTFARSVGLMSLMVLPISAGVIHQRLLRRIAACNGVPAQPVEPRELGECICVPFGKILRGVAVPNTVTKTLHTDKVYEPDLSRSSIESYPFYASLPDQVRTIRAFDRPVILVDDMLHDGKRIRRLAPSAEKSKVPVTKSPWSRDGTICTMDAPGNSSSSTMPRRLRCTTRKSRYPALYRGRNGTLSFSPPSRYILFPNLTGPKIPGRATWPEG